MSARKPDWFDQWMWVASACAVCYLVLVTAVVIGGIWALVQVLRHWGPA